MLPLSDELVRARLREVELRSEDPGVRHAREARLARALVQRRRHSRARAMLRARLAQS